MFGDPLHPIAHIGFILFAGNEQRAAMINHASKPIAEFGADGYQEMGCDLCLSGATIAAQNSKIIPPDPAFREPMQLYRLGVAPSRGVDSDKLQRC